jgi:hypothetical protein
MGTGSKETGESPSRVGVRILKVGERPLGGTSSISPGNDWESDVGVRGDSDLNRLDACSSTVSCAGAGLCARKGACTLGVVCVLGLCDLDEARPREWVCSPRGTSDVERTASLAGVRALAGVLALEGVFVRAGVFPPDGSTGCTRCRIVGGVSRVALLGMRARPGVWRPEVSATAAEVFGCSMLTVGPGVLT